MQTAETELRWVISSTAVGDPSPFYRAHTIFREYGRPNQVASVSPQQTVISPPVKGLL